MASFTDTIAAARGFESALDALAENGAFEEFERDGFRRLNYMYGSRSRAFAIKPAYGTGSSPHYDKPKGLAEAGIAACAAARPGKPATQQPVYDAAYDGGAALAEVTAGAIRASRKAPVS